MGVLKFTPWCLKPFTPRVDEEDSFRFLLLVWFEERKKKGQ